MGNYIDSKKESLKSKIVGRRIYENDCIYFSKLLSQCTEETLVESKDYQYFGQGEIYTINHYLLPSGIHVYTIPLRNISYISGQKIPLEQIEHQNELWDTQTIAGSYVELQNAFDGDKRIVYASSLSDTPMFVNSFAVDKDGVCGFIGKEEIPESAESTSDYITSPQFTSLYGLLSKKDAATARRSFQRLFSEIDRSEFVDYSDDDILIMLLEDATQIAEEEAEKGIKAANSFSSKYYQLLKREDSLREKLSALIEIISKLDPKIGQMIFSELDKALGRDSQEPTEPTDPTDPTDPSDPSDNF